MAHAHASFSRLIPSVLVGAILAAPLSLKADLTLINASSIVQSTATDADFGFLTAFFGFQTGQTVNYSSTATASAWTGTLSGSYLGVDLSVAYVGDSSAYPSGALTWTDTGVYGTQVWSGSGSATIDNTSATTFQMSFADSLTVGGFDASISYVIPGTVQPDGTIMYGDPANEEVGAGTAIAGSHGGEDPFVIYFSYRDKQMLIKSDEVLGRKDSPPPPGKLENRYVESGGDLGGRLFGLDGTIDTVPEPSMWPLLLVGLGAVCMLSRRKARTSSQTQ